MPWWIWLLLALFLLVMIVAGLIYAALHGIRALKDMSDIGGQLGARVAAMGESGTSADTSEPPLVTLPPSVAQIRYAEVHADLIRSKAVKRERHTQAWARWKRFNN